MVPVKEGVKETPLQVVMLMLFTAAVGNTDTVAVNPKATIGT